MISLSTSHYKYGDIPVTATNSENFANPVWSTQSGIVVGSGSTVTIVPANKTIENKIAVYSANLMTTFTNPEGGITYNSGNLVRGSGSGSSTAFTSNIPPIGENWIEATFNVSSSTQAIGFNISNNSGTGPFYSASWVVSNGVATCRVDGQIIATTSTVNGDIFRVVVKNGKKISFNKNYETVKEHFKYPLFTTMFGAVVFVGSGTAFNARYYLNSSPKASTILKSYGVFPVLPNYPYDITTEDASVVLYGEDQTEYSITKPAKDVLTLSFNYRTLEEYQILKKFWDHHTKTIPFFYDDTVAKYTRWMKFDSGLKVTIQRMNVMGINITLREGKKMAEFVPGSIYAGGIPLTDAQGAVITVPGGQELTT